METTLHYLFDPLCGWCYGAAPAIASLHGRAGITVRPVPTGMFAGEGARPMDDAFATYAWSNDQRIEGLTGQRFTARYRQRVLDDRRQPFDSGPATVALTAVSLSAPARELEALEAIQHDRFVAGEDVTSLVSLARLLEALGLGEAAVRIARPDPDLLRANRARVDRAQSLMREFGARGVPALIAESGSKRWMLDHGAAYANPRALIQQLEVV